LRLPVAACVLVLVAGCSFLSVPIARPKHPADPPRCTGSVVAPVADIVVAAGGAAALGAGIYQANTCRGELCSLAGVQAVIVGTLAAALMTGSAAYGFVQTHKCRCLEERHEGYIRLHPE
jgi:hypothetical protein